MQTDDAHNRLLASKVLVELAGRNINGSYAQTKEAALEAILDMVPVESTASFAGSQTLRDIGLREALRAHGCTLWDPDDGKTGAEKDEIAHRALAADVYFTSVNAIALTGELVTADGYGNRAASLIFGPRRVIIVVGVNKIVPTVETAIQRTRIYAAQRTVMLFKQDYPSYDELARVAETACSHLVITERSATKDRMSLVLVGERLGF